MFKKGCYMSAPVPVQTNLMNIPHKIFKCNKNIKMNKNVFVNYYY